MDLDINVLTSLMITWVDMVVVVVVGWRVKGNELPPKQDTKLQH